jgi:hypothetical protein
MTAVKTFLAGNFALRNVANTFSYFVTNTITANRTMTLPDYDFQPASLSGTETLSGKRIQKRVVATTQSATPTINTNN